MLISWINKYYKIIIICLAVLLFFSTCRSCSRKQAYQFAEVENQVITDSLQLQIVILYDSIADLNSQISIQEALLEQYLATIGRLDADKATLKSINTKILNNR